MTSDHGTEDTYLGQYAGFATRFVAFVIDLVIVTVIVSLTFTVGQIILDSLESLFLLHFSGPTARIAVVIISLVAVSFYLTYSMGFWMLLGQTPGKRTMGVRIVRTDGGRVGFARAALRLFGYYVSMIFFAGYFWILMDKRRQGLHDKIGATFVVYSWPEPRPKITVRGLQEGGGQSPQEAKSETAGS